MNLNTIKYVKEFDSIRALAVLLVIIWHWAPRGVDLILPLGSIGVDIFFVLSGFLITWILLLEKGKEKKYNKFKSIGNFVIRRGLRIFPIYYLLLIVLYFGHIFLPNPIPQDFLFYALYVQNILFYVEQSFPWGNLSHLWTLAVEEQFYLVWPFLIIFISKRFLIQVLLFGIFLGSASSVLFPLLADKNELTDILTINCIHSFCIGGLSSYLLLFKKDFIEKYYLSIKYCSQASITVYILLNVFSDDYLYFNRLLISIFISWVFIGIVLEKFNSINWLLRNRYLISVGKVSYGIYLFHNFIPTSIKAVFIYLIEDITLTSKVILFHSLSDFWNLAVFNLLCFITLLLISYSSYFLIEKPILKLKVYFK